MLGAIAVPASLVNSSLDYITYQLSIRFRVSLTKFFSEKYLESLSSFRMIYIDRQLTHDILTEEIDMFSTCLSNLLSTVIRPLLDIILFCVKLNEILGIKGPLIVLAWYSASGIILSLLNSPVNTMNKVLHQVQKNYRTSHEIIAEYSEEIAFFRGMTWEKKNTAALESEVIENTNSLIHKKFLMKTTSNIISKYGALIIAQAVMSMPAFTSQAKSGPELAKDYIKTSSYFVNISKATTRFRLAYKNIRSLVINTRTLYQSLVNLTEVPLLEFPEITGEYRLSNSIRFENVNIITPEGNLLFENMDFAIEEGMNTMIQGPHGCGMSSILRVLGGLWPLFSGVIYSPNRDDLFFINNTPYLPYGSLESQFSYPKSPEVNSARIAEIIKTVRLGKILEKYNLKSIADWNAVLSLKQQQMLGLGRILYHRPKFVLLDECTNAISVRLEHEIYNHLKTLGVTVITLSQRESMLKYHSFVLKLHDEGTWNFYKVSHIDP